MTSFQGFKSKAEAEHFRREHGGIVCWAQRTPKRKQLTKIGRYYMMAVHLGGLDQENYPYCVQWNDLKA